MDGDGIDVATEAGAQRVPAQPNQRRGRPPRAGLASARREHFTQAAYSVFAEYSYEDAQVSEIARRAGVGQATLYRYVDGKRELLDLVVDWCAERVFAAIDVDEILDGADADGPDAPQAMITDLGDRLYALIDEEPNLLRILAVQAGAVDRELRYRVSGLYSAVNGLIIRALSRAAERGWIDADAQHLELIAHLLPSLSMPGFILALSGDQDQEVTRAEYVACAAQLSRYGLLGAGRREVE
ncbi:TetR/AcrR family transcriptional regulator [Gordonia sp. X0973]|uniref:TetR/AcrR family transcriptional regulator n=1 Tax=Gordonia sp. X0973 TaxID=2742602 RepID=UPI000F51BF63|nr:TetR/AcrR family transcriptional regulator [Gordonia sp. X0973]QKT06118.1 TetR/AcrR family transcriptional regulator [Gordonia sp. X0973]